VTGEGESLEITIVADTLTDLATRVAGAGQVGSARLKANNDAIVAAGETLEKRTRAVYADAVQRLRQELGLRAERPEQPEEPTEDVPIEVPPPGDEDAPEEEEAADAHAALRAVHAPTHP